ncbi:MAG TPA: trypsin-like peptidase domain-containing protein [Planctomycetota bacterium]|nr:trypsin-like peptidase domain-containing protein [Planctomycetota bacterium]
MMKPWVRAILVTFFLAGGVAAGMGLGRVIDPLPGAALAAERRATPPGLAAFQDELAGVAEAVSPSVVHIMTTVGGQDDLFQSKGVGSGVIVSAEGHIITNHHVVDSEGLSQKLRVRLSDGKEFPAKIVGSDSDADLALIKIEPRGARLQPIRFADSGEVRVGHLCLAVGSPFGYSNSVTFGMVSGKHRRAALAQPYQDFIQTDAPINPGNSGGALVNIRGELIGINAAIISETRGSDGVGFAIASNLVKWVSDQLREHGRVRRGYMGVRPIDFDDPALESIREKLLADVGLKEQRGVFVYSVEFDSPADRAGLKKGDVILEFDGEAVAGQSAMFFRVAEASPGATVTLKVLHERKERNLKVVVGERPPVDSHSRPR